MAADEVEPPFEVEDVEEEEELDVFVADDNGYDND
jgi:hypothetical protein